MLAPNTRDPGVDKSELIEADLDLEWSEAIAPESSVMLVYSYDVTDAVTYAVDENLAPVISMSYGYCEAQTTAADAQLFEATAQQANAQGITWFAASGDSGATDCAERGRAMARSR